MSGSEEIPPHHPDVEKRKLQQQAQSAGESVDLNQNAQKSGAIGRGAIWSFLDLTMRQVLALLVFLVTARFVAPEAFGILAVSLLVVEGFRQITIESVGVAITSSNDPKDEDYNASFMIIAVISFISAALVYIFADFFGQLLDNPEIADTLRMVCILLATIGLSRTHEAWLARNFHFKALAIRSIGSIILGGTVGIIMAVQGFGLMALVTQQLVTAISAAILLWAYTDWKPRFKTKRENVVRLLHYSKHVAMTGVTNFTHGQSDIFFSSLYLGEAATGIYNAAKRVALAMNIIMSSSLNRIALPAFANIQSDNDKISAAFLQAVRLTSLCTAPVYAGIAIVAPEIVHILLGDKWAAAAPILAILMVNGYLTTIGQYNHAIMLTRNKPHWQTVLTTIYAIVNVVLFVVFGKYGLIALALAFVGRALFLYPLSAGAALKLLSISPLKYIQQIIPSIMAALIMVGGLEVLKIYIYNPQNAFLSLLMFVPLGAVIYGISIFIINRKMVYDLIAELKSISKK